jgi:hypothetical protein
MNWYLRWIAAQLTITAICSLFIPLVYKLWRVW